MKQLVRRCTIFSVVPEEVSDSLQLLDSEGSLPPVADPDLESTDLSDVEYLYQGSPLLSSSPVNFGGVFACVWTRWRCGCVLVVGPRPTRLL